jgi:ribosome recycling factor
MGTEKISYKEILDDLEKELKKVFGFFSRELSKIRAERISPSLVEDIRVNYMAKEYSLKELATIRVARKRELIIKPWDKSYIEDIISSLNKSDIQANPVVDGEVVRLKLPSLSKEFREDLIRLVSRTQEQAKQTVRKWRDEAWSRLKNAEQAKKMTEDQKYKGKKQMEKMVGEYNDKIDEKADQKIESLK